MNNKTLMTKVIELDKQTLHTREQSQRVMIQIATIRKAFGVKNDETDLKVLDYERERILTDQEIEKDFNNYVRLYDWAIDKNDSDKAKEFENQIYYLIEGIKFFDEQLANKFKNSFTSKQLELV